jgi:hypothetical protein
MAGTAILDIVEGDIKITLENGIEMTRTIRVHGLTGTASDRMLEAVDVATVPVIGAAHPGRSSCLLREISGGIESQDIVKLSLRYTDVWRGITWGYNSSPPSDSTIQVGATVSQVENSKTWAGSSIEIGPPASISGDSNRTDDEKSIQAHTISRFEPEATIVVTKSVTAYNPLDMAMLYVGKTNQEGWTLRPYDPSNTWLCTGITGQSVDGGVTYQVTFTFVNRKNIYVPVPGGPIPGNGAARDIGWDTVIAWRDPKNGQLPPGMKTGDGEIQIAVYDTANFNNLRLLT